MSTLLGVAVLWSTVSVVPWTNRPYTYLKIAVIMLAVIGTVLLELSRRLPPWPRKAVLFYWTCWFPAFITTIDYPSSIIGAYQVPGGLLAAAFSGGLLAAGLGAMAYCLAYGMPAAGRRWVIAAGWVAAIHALVQVAGWDHTIRGLPDGNRAIAMVGSPTDLGALFVVLLVAQRNPLFLIGLWATGSRGAWLGAAVSLLPVRLRPLGFVLAAGVSLFGVLHGSSLSDRFRVEIWRTAVQDFHWLGTGPATFGRSFLYYRTIGTEDEFSARRATFHAHNSVLEAAVTRGIPGLLGLLAFLVAPQMAGLWLILMFNPVSPDILFVACVVAGMTQTQEVPRWWSFTKGPTRTERPRDRSSGPATCWPWWRCWPWSSTCS
jgi:O-antigen ligase